MDVDPRGSMSNHSLPLLGGKKVGEFDSVHVDHQNGVTQTPHGGILQRSLQDARAAFINRDPEATRVAHRPLSQVAVPVNTSSTDHSPSCTIPGASHSEGHSTASAEYLKAIVFGGLDGIITIFAIVAGCVGARLTAVQTVTVGIGNLFADAIAMGFGEYVSSVAEDEYILAEKERECWELEHCPAEEKMEMVTIYQNRHGFSKEDAESMVNIAFKYPDFFISHMMVEELGLMLWQEGNATPSKRGGVMFLSFATFGLVPLATFFGWNVASNTLGTHGNDPTVSFIVACLSSAVTLFMLGFSKGKLLSQNPTQSGMMMVMNGVFSGTVAYGIGSLLQAYVGQM